jgi:uncharacterized protein (TIGR03435 family)
MRMVMLASCLFGAITLVGAQESAQPTFEVATVKQNKGGDTNGMLRTLPGGRVSATNMPLRPVITYAYQLAQYQLIGGPNWLTTDRYDIVAKLEDNPTQALPTAGQPDPMMLAMRNLLADRFKLKLHRESREMDIYALVMAKPGGGPGPNLKQTTQDCAAMAAAARRGGPPPAPSANGVPPCGIQIGPGRIRFGGLPASMMPSAFGQSGRMVVDRTGLTGSWDFELNFAPEGRGAPAGVDTPAPSDAPSFFTAIQEQLGLKLESTKGPVDVIVIDSIEKPTED